MAPPVREMADTPIPGALVVWQGMAAALGGALLASMLGIAKLEERSASDAKMIAELQGEVRTLVAQVQSLSVELARQSERIGQMQANHNAARNGLHLNR